jgi:hypothetical protein
MPVPVIHGRSASNSRTHLNIALRFRFRLTFRHIIPLADNYSNVSRSRSIRNLFFSSAALSGFMSAVSAELFQRPLRGFNPLVNPACPLFSSMLALQSLRHRRRPAMVSRLFIGVCESNHVAIVVRSTQKDDPRRKIIPRKSRGHHDHRNKYQERV